MGDNGVVAVVDDIGDGFQCADHPYRSNQGGICAFCLQERLGKLVSSKSPSSFFPHPTSSSPSSPPDPVTLESSASFLSKKKTTGNSTTTRKTVASSSSSSATTNNSYSLKRSKSVAPKPLGGVLETGNVDSPRIKKSFWSFLYHPSPAGAIRRISTSTASLKQQQPAAGNRVDNASEVLAESPGDSQTSSSFGRKVSRSRSVGCGSRSFSGDFLERISFGDCTLRRVESQREAKPKYGNGAVGFEDEQHRFKCGGLFGGFGMVITEARDEYENAGRRMSTSARMSAPHGRIKSWGWASLASPMRAFRPTPATIGAAPPATTVITTTVGSNSNSSIVNGKMASNPTMLTVGS